MLSYAAYDERTEGTDTTKAHEDWSKTVHAHSTVDIVLKHKNERLRLLHVNSASSIEINVGQQYDLIHTDQVRDVTFEFVGLFNLKTNADFMLCSENLISK